MWDSYRLLFRRLAVAEHALEKCRVFVLPEAFWCWLSLLARKNWKCKWMDGNTHQPCFLHLVTGWC